MSTTIFTPKTFDFKNLQLSPEKAQPNSKHNIKYRYYQLTNSRNKILIQSPKLTTPFGLRFNEPMEGSSGGGSWSLGVCFPNLDAKKFAEDGVAEFGKDAKQGEIDFFTFCAELDKFTENEMNKGIKKTRLTGTKTYKPMLKVSENKHEPGKYYCNVNFKVNGFNGVQLKAINAVTGVISNGVDKITKFSDLVVVFSLGRVYVQSDKFGPHQFADRVQFWPQNGNDEMTFLDADGNVENLAKVKEEEHDPEADNIPEGEIEFMDE